MQLTCPWHCWNVFESTPQLSSLNPSLSLIFVYHGKEYLPSLLFQYVECCWCEWNTLTMKQETPSNVVCRDMPNSSANAEGMEIIRGQIQPYETKSLSVFRAWSKVLLELMEKSNGLQIRPVFQKGEKVWGGGGGVEEQSIIKPKQKNR